jgi:hypothetical protein
MEHWYLLFLGILATWRLTHLLNAENGPWKIIARVREWRPEGILHELLSCFLCLSVWIAVPFAYLLGDTWELRGLLLPALSGAAILVERVTQRLKPTLQEAS